METFTSPDCWLCNNRLPLASEEVNGTVSVVCVACCGTGLHTKCVSKFKENEKSKCSNCKKKNPSSSQKIFIKYLRKWVKKEVGWAQHYLGELK